jgi:hypothetical protein
MNPYKNILQKVKALLKEDDQLTAAQCELFQWQQLVKIPGDYVFNVGKGGVNTIFYSASSEDRAVCYPDEILTLLEKLAKGKVFAYAALDKSKNILGYSVNDKVAKKFKGARYLATISFSGELTTVQRKIVGLDGKKSWQK